MDIVQGNYFYMGIDLEASYDASIFDSVLTIEEKKKLPDYTVPSTNFLLDILEKYHHKVTFFCLGSVARKHPHLIRKISEAGHEIAAHSMNHKRIDLMDPQEFYEDAKQIKYLLEDISGKKVVGYRAPTFSINEKTCFFYPILESLDYQYSSSLFPIHYRYYGDPKGPRFPYISKKQSILEIPITTYEIFQKRIPMGGGGWFRIMPYFLYQWCVQKLHKQNHPVIFYTHPWEYCLEQPIIQKIHFLKRWKHYINIKQMPYKFEKICKAFQWNRMDQVQIIDPFF